MSGSSRAVRAIGWAGLGAGAADLAFILVYYALKHVPPARVLQGVAAGAVGPDAAVQGGLTMAVLGLAFHFFISFCVAAAFYALSRRWRWLVDRPIPGGLVFGLGVWLFMTLAVLPLTATPPRGFPPPLWMPVLLAHLLCVGLPIALIVRRLAR